MANDGKSTGGSRWLVPVVTFLMGAGAAIALIPPAQVAPTTPAPSLTVPADANGIDASSLAQEAELYHQINRQFVEQLRKYHTRLREISSVAEAEGATSAARQMEDFALETELLIQRYDRIVRDGD